MATRVAGRSGGLTSGRLNGSGRFASLVARSGLVALIGLAATGCENEDPNATAISQASTQLRAISPGSVPPVNDEFATKRYQAAAGKLAPAGSGGTVAQQSIASILGSEIAFGQARPAMTKLAELEHEIGTKLTRMMSLETARVSAQQTAEALGNYNPAAERTAIDQSASTLQQRLSESQAERQALETRVQSLGSQITALEGQVGTIRAEESSLRDRALREDPITAAETFSQAREAGRRADGLEVQSSTLAAQRAVLTPQIEALGVRIDAINTQLTILSQARESVAQQARRATDDAAAAQSLARQYAAELAALAAEIGALHQTEAQAAVGEARQALDKAVSTARRANAQMVDGTLAAAGASRSLGDLLGRRAASLGQTTGLFSELAGRSEGEQSRRLSTLAEQLAREAEGLKSDAITAYELAAGNFRRVRAQGATREALQKAADDLDRAIERLGGRVGGSSVGGADEAPEETGTHEGGEFGG